MDEKAYETGSNGQKSVRVFLINPPTGDAPWATRAEWEAQKTSARRLAVLSMLAAIAAIVSSAMTCVIAYSSVRALQYRQPPTQQTPQQLPTGTTPRP
jgi:hypothetical protein